MLLGSIYTSRGRSKKEGNGDSGGEQINRLPAGLLLDKVQIQQETRAIAGDCFRWNKNALEMFEIHLVINRYHNCKIPAGIFFSSGTEEKNCRKR